MDMNFSGCSTIEKVCLPSQLTQIGNFTFASCRNLTQIGLGDALQKIGQSAFQDTGLQTISFPSTLTTIGLYAFLRGRLTELDIPASVTKIEQGAFQSCSILTSVTLRSTTPPTLGNDAFKSTNASLVIYVPESAVDTYKAASGWSNYASKITAIPES